MALGGRPIPGSGSGLAGPDVCGQLVPCGWPRRGERHGGTQACLSVGLPVTLAEIGVTTDEQIRTIAKNSCVEGETIHNMAGDVTPDELYDAIVLADALGQQMLGSTTEGC